MKIKERKEKRKGGHEGESREEGGRKGRKKGDICSKYSKLITIKSVCRVLELIFLLVFQIIGIFIINLTE